VTFPRNCTAIRPVARPAGRPANWRYGLLATLMVGTAAHAEPIGSVSELDGTLLVSAANGALKVLAVSSPLQQGDTLATRKETYARLTLTDNSTVTLGPDTELTIQTYAFHVHTPQGDGALVSLARGRVSIATGTLGTRDADTFILATPSATIDIRRASLLAEYVTAARATAARYNATTRGFEYLLVQSFETRALLPATFNDSTEAASTSRLQLAQAPLPPLPPLPNSATRAPGLYVHVIDGLIHVTNPAGTQNFTAGQFGFTPSFKQPPIVLPTNPGMQFTPPPTFSSSTPSQGGTAGGKPGDVNCQVR
jgi:hypothetical protein